ncbi:hypothetical protein KUTeg_018129 [Tegillarca granosa]|uniref:Elongation factor EFG domain-containing protein n=1 Tax=Tegillarca granosa TaxID=220873 RepID=A0ABQ9EJF3_TEGGR|nr:hypothetical protein KUTeg_018129 [Tegillarca granosa]
MIEKIVKSLGLTISARDARHNDFRVKLQSITSQWMPVSKAVLNVVVEMLPSPLQLCEEKCKSEDGVPVIVFVSKMFPLEKKMLPKNRQRKIKNTTDMIGTISLESSRDVNIREDKKDDEVDLEFVAFARVYSGTIKKGQKLYVLGPKHNPSKRNILDTSKLDTEHHKTVAELDSDEHITSFTVSDLYLFMGREVEIMEEIPAGNILGIGGLEDHILNSATISSTPACTAFTDLYFDASPIVRVALETKHTGDMKNLVRGLKLLNQADPCVEVLVQESGEHVIIAAGEVHLQRCVDDLKERYGKVDLNVSDPIVPFRETIITRPKTDMVNEAIMNQNLPAKHIQLKKFEDDEEVIEAGLVEVYTANKKCYLKIRALPLPEKVTCILDENQHNIKILDQLTNEVILDQSVESQVNEINVDTLEALKELKEKLDKAFKESGKNWRNAVNEIWAFGPRRVGPNILLNRISDYKRPNVWSSIERESSCKDNVRDFDNSIVSGFEIATLAGPLCEEPMRGVCYIIEKWEYVDQNGYIIQNSTIGENESSRLNTFKSDSLSKEGDDKKNGCNNEQDVNISSAAKQEVDNSERTRLDSCESNEELEISDNVGKKKQEVYGPFSGQLISCVKDGCRKAFQTQQQRLMAAMYKCDIQATAEVLGKLYAVIGKRNGRIQEGDMREGTQMFNIIAYVPVIESFGFAEDIRKKTSGLARPQLVFSHWEVVDVDPFWVPTTEEEYLHFGEKADCANRALVYMNTVRTRKGLKVDKKIVEHAEKQRTLTKNK